MPGDFTWASGQSWESSGLQELQLRCVPLTVHRASLQRAKTDRNIMEHMGYKNCKDGAGMRWAQENGVIK
jgi:hypothetical protein